MKLTPYDPDAYLLRSVTALGMTRPAEALKDLDTALRLDPQYPPSRAFAAAAGRIALGGGGFSLKVLTELPRYSREMTAILERYKIQIDPDSQ